MLTSKLDDNQFEQKFNDLLSKQSNISSFCNSPVLSKLSAHNQMTINKPTQKKKKSTTKSQFLPLKAPLNILRNQDSYETESET